MFAAIHPQLVRNLILLAAGIDFSTRDGLINLWTTRGISTWMTSSTPLAIAPRSSCRGCSRCSSRSATCIQKPQTLLERLDDDRFVHEYFTMETWLNDNIPMPGEVFREFVKYLYQQNQLVTRQLPIGGHRVDFKNISCPVLNLMATKDDLVPCAQSEPFNDLVGSSDRKTIKLPAGHIGLAMGSRAQRELWPEACRWLAERSDAVTAD